MKHFKMLLLISSVALFTACGGGGGGDTTPPPSDDDTIIEAPPAPEIPETPLPEETVFNWDDYIILPTNDFTAAITDTQDVDNIAEVLVSQVSDGLTKLYYRWDFRYTSGIRYPQQEFTTSISQDFKDINLYRNTRNGFGITHFDISLHVTKVDNIIDGDIIGQATIKYTDRILFDDPVPVDVQVSYIDDEIIKLKFSYHDITNNSVYTYDIEISPVIGTFDIYVNRDDSTGSNLVHKVEISPV